MEMTRSGYRMVTGVLHHVIKLQIKSVNLMLCWPCIIVNQYNQTDVMHISFNLLRIKGFYMFTALLPQPQEALNKRRLAYCVCMSVGYGTVAVSLQPCHSQLTLNACNIQNAVCAAYAWGRASNARNMYRPLILNKLNEMCITLVSLYWHKVRKCSENCTMTILIHLNLRLPN
jgi:hypothetical protein